MFDLTLAGGGSGNPGAAPYGGHGLSQFIAGLAATALFIGLVHGVLVAAHVSEPASTTVYGLTPRRLWATTIAAVGLIGAVLGGVALARPSSRLAQALGDSEPW